MSQFKFVILFIFIILSFSCKNDKNTVTLKGEIANLENSEILVSYYAADTMAIDTIRSNKKGKFTYKNKIDTLTVFSLLFNNQTSSVLVFAHPNDKISIIGDAQITDLIKVTGNEINNELTSFKESNNDLLKQRSLLLHNLRNERASDSLQNGRVLTSTDEIAQINSLNQELMMNAEDYVQKNPTKMSSLILINDFFTNSENPKGLNRVLEYMQGDVLKSKMGLNLKAYSEKINRSAEGAAMPYFQLVDKKGDTIQSNDFRGKHLLLSFVSTAGKDSRDVVKALKKSYQNLSKDSVKFISIYIDSDVYPITHLESDSIPWTVVPEKKSWASDIVDAYNVEFIPNNILISPTGIITNRNIPAVAVENALKNSTKK